ncbi:hypothetical protein PM082_023910 [Marasmius tenuissimus]|nr:hypothetical protein PM082_023910 [Marasmius tenuissimus]
MHAKARAGSSQSTRWAPYVPSKKGENRFDPRHVQAVSRQDVGNAQILLTMSIRQPRQCDVLQLAKMKWVSPDHSQHDAESIMIETPICGDRGYHAAIGDQQGPTGSGGWHPHYENSPEKAGSA